MINSHLLLPTELIAIKNFWFAFDTPARASRHSDITAFHKQPAFLFTHQLPHLAAPNMVGINKIPVKTKPPELWKAPGVFIPLLESSELSREDS